MSAQILCGDVLAMLATLPSDSVDCCVTSPPYWGLRDYGHEGQIGLEKTPQEFVAKMVEVFRQVRRVLKPAGTCWVNLGDSYANDGKWGGSFGGKHVEALHGDTGVGRAKRETGLKPKDLCMIPARVAIALQDDGWYLRQDIIWSKPNPMPESVTDRCTKAHEYVFLLTKSAKYWYDADAIKEELALSSIARLSQDVESQQGSDRVPGKTNGSMKAVGPGMNFRRENPSRVGVHPGKMNDHRPDRQDTVYSGTRNKRSVWVIPTKPYKEAHFATFPEELALNCILAGCPFGGTVLDPFAGSGTTGAVAEGNGRNSILIELNPEYIPLIQKRLSKVTPPLDLFQECAA